MKSPMHLKHYMSLQFCIVAAVPLIIIAVLIWLFIMPTMSARTSIQHNAMARSIAGQISAQMGGAQHQLFALAEYLQNHEITSDQRLLPLLDTQCGEGGLFETIFLAAKDNLTIQAVGLPKSRRSERAELIGLDLSGRPFIHAAKNLKRAVWSQTYLSTISGHLAVALTVPIKNGFVTGEITLDHLSKMISHLPGEEGFTTLVLDGQGRIVADSRKLPVGHKLYLDDSPPKGTTGTTHTSSGTFKLDGEQLLGTRVKMNVPSWKVFVAQPIAKAFKPLRDTYGLMAVGLAIALGIAVFLSWRQSGKVTRLVHFYMGRAEAIAQGNYDHQWPQTKITEYDNLGTSLKGMAEKISRREKALSDSEHQLRELSANVPGVVYQFRSTRDHVYTNEFLGRKTTEVFGLEPDPETFSEKFSDCIPDDEKERFIGSIRDAVDRIEPWNYEGRFIKPEGKTIWFSGNAVPSDEGESIVFYGVLMDITERKRIEESLRLTQFIFDKAPIGIWRMGEAGEILDVNAKGWASLGYTREELCRMTVFDFDPNYDLEKWSQTKTHLKEVGTRTIESQHRRKNGDIFPIQVISFLMQYEAREFMVAFVQDITERKKTEDSLRLTQFIFDKAPIGIWRMGEKGEVLEVNEEGCASLGHTREELRRMVVFDFDPAMDRKRWAEGARILKKVGNRTIDSLHQRRNGEIFPIQVVEKMVRFEDQDLHVAFVQDFTERKRMEQALKESEERLDLALSGANEGIWDWNINEDILYLDSRYYTMAGYEPNEFPAKFDEILNRIHKDDLERVTSVNAQYLAGDLETFEVEFRFLRKDGSFMWIQAKGKFVAWDDQGSPTRFVGTHADITKRKQAEEALRENERLLTNILESMHEGLFVLDSDFKSTIFNRSLGNIIDVTKEEAIGKTPWESSPVLKNTAVEKNIRKTMRGESAGNLEIQLPFPSGKMKWFRDSFSPLKDDDGNVIGMVGVVSDITQHKQDEEELRRLRNYLSNIIDSMPSALVGVDADGQITQWNKTVEKVTGIPPEAAQGKALSDLMPWMASDMIKIAESMRTRQIQQDQKRPRALEDGTCYEDVTIYPLVTNGIEGAVIRIDDVTERVRMEEMMVQSEKMLSVGGLAAGMAHEINNPLAGILQTAEVMANRLGTDLQIPASRKAAEDAGTTLEAIENFMKARGIPRMIDTIQESGQRVADIVKNMLSFARKSEAAFTSHMLGQLLDRTLELAATDYDLKKQYDFKRIKLVKEYTKDLPSVPCEGPKIQQVLLNILRNGAQAMQQAGTESPRFIFRTRFEPDKNMAVMEIEDNGPGMDEMTRKRVFEPFFTTKQQGEGTGLGLSVSYFIITENHDGEMDVESRPGFGSKFIIRLPVKGEQIGQFDKNSPDH